MQMKYTRHVTIVRHVATLKQSLSPDTGKWEKPFDATLTDKADFNVDENTVVQVDMMKRTGRYDFYQDNHTSVIMLPYKSNTSMMIMLPNEGKMHELEGAINKEYIKLCLESVSRR